MHLRVTLQFAANCHLFSWGGMHSCKTNMMQLFVDVCGLFWHWPTFCRTQETDSSSHAAPAGAQRPSQALVRASLKGPRNEEIWFHRVSWWFAEWPRHVHWISVDIASAFVFGSRVWTELRHVPLVGAGTRRGASQCIACDSAQIHITKGSSSGATFSFALRSKGEGGQPRYLIILEIASHFSTPSPAP